MYRYIDRFRCFYLYFQLKNTCLKTRFRAALGILAYGSGLSV